MPSFDYKCTHCDHTESKIVLYAKKDEQICSNCGEKTEYQLSFRFAAQGLPNGFAPTRSSSRDKKPIGGADSK